VLVVNREFGHNGVLQLMRDMHSQKPKIIVTLGPATNTEDAVRGLKERGVDFVRVNMSHSSLSDQGYFMRLAEAVGIPFVLDTEGSQVRNGVVASDVFINEGDMVRIHTKPVQGTRTGFSLRPATIFSQIEIGDLIYVDFDALVFRVLDTAMVKTRGYITAITITGGKMGANKGVVVDSPTRKQYKLPALSSKDREAIKIAMRHGVGHIAVSFVRSAATIDEVRALTKNSMKIISKIECVEALQNLDEIISKSDFLLIDRGDLSREVALERIPLVQKLIIGRANAQGKGVFVATNLLESMVSRRAPTRAEAHDVIQTVLDGAYGLTLAAETAIGAYPMEVVNTLNKFIAEASALGVINSSSRLAKHLDKREYLQAGGSRTALIPPNGGVLIDRFSDSITTAPKGSASITITEEQYMDLEQIALGVFSPLEGFLTRRQLNSVLDTMRLPSGSIWPMPIVLDVSESDARKLKIRTNITLKNRQGVAVGILHLDEKYVLNRKEFIRKMYGTLDAKHPGVAQAMLLKPVFLGGKVTLLKRRSSATKAYELTPQQTRRLFAERGWSKIVAFHTRNPIHRAHEFIQLDALRQSCADGLFAHPAIGKKKSGDFQPEPVIEAYNIMMRHFYPKNKVIFGAYATYPRYAGPREALFTALCRQNFGCSHFIVGRDHAGVGSFYEPTAAQDIFDDFPEIGIQPVRFNQVFYSAREKRHIHDNRTSKRYAEKERKHISGTRIRTLLLQGKPIPKWFMRPEISRMISSMIKKDRKKVFVS
jgi:pyruvate kinase